MKTRIQLIQNSHIHRVPTILLSIYRTQFIFNVIPTLLRHRKNHKINLYNSSHIFFTKNSIQTLGGLPNYLLFRSGAQKNSNPVFANRIHIYGDKQIYNYLQKLRFKLGYKILRTSYCQWDAVRNRIGISKVSLLDSYRLDSQFFRKFANIDEHIKQGHKKDVDYYNSTHFIQNKPNQFISIPCQHFHHDFMDIYPLITSNGGIHCSYICIPTLRKKGIDINVDLFIQETGINNPTTIRELINYGFIKLNDGKIVRKDDYLFRQDYKPKNIIIFHYANKESITELINHRIFNNYIQNNNQTGVVIHIVEDLSLLKTKELSTLISKFDAKVKHLWFNKHSHSIDINSCDDLHHEELKFWTQHFPWLFQAMDSNQKTFLDYGRQIITQQFPYTANYFYQRFYNLIMNDFQNDRYEKRKKTQSGEKKIDILKNLLLSEHESVEKLKKAITNLSYDGKFMPKVAFLGTASSMPTSYKNTLGIHVSLDQNISFILDCGEGTLQQLADHIPPQNYQQQLLKIRVIFITHIHSDHNLGILNFISQRNKIMKQHKSKDKLFLIIPFNVYNWYQEFNRIIQNLNEGCSVLFTQIITHSAEEIKEEINIMIRKNKKNQDAEQKKFFSKNRKKLECKKTNHLQQIQSSHRTKELVMKELPNQVSTYQNFKSLLKQHNYKGFKPVKVIHCPQSYGIVIQNQRFKVSYSGDTKPAPQFVEAAKNSSLMIHEATFNDEQQEKATRYMHSTVFDAIKVGKQANASKIALTHYSQNFGWPKDTSYNSSYEEYFKNHTIFSFDHLNLYLQAMEQLPQITQFIMKMDHEASIRLEKKNERIDESHDTDDNDSK